MASEQQKHATPITYGYFTLLMALAVLPEKLASTPLKFIYKDQLHLDPQASANLAAIIAIPGYIAFAFGLCRDRFSPLKMGDRGFILAFGILAGLTFMVISRIPLTFDSLAAGLLLVYGFQTMLRAAYQAIMRNTAEVRMMSGRMSTIYNAMSTAIPFVATYTGGWLIDHHVGWRGILVIVGLGYVAFGLFGRWKPAAIFDGLPAENHSTPTNFWGDVKALARRRAFWVAAAIWGLWAFSPGANTAIYYHMTNALKMSQTETSTYDGLTTLTLVPTILLFGLLIKRVSLWPLLVIAAIVAIPQMIPLMLIHNAHQAYAAATFMGLTGGLATAAFWSVVIRASPQGLAGTGMLMAISFGHISVQGSDVLGGWLFKHHGFTGCAIVTTVAYLFLLPLIFALPRELLKPADDQRIEAGG